MRKILIAEDDPIIRELLIQVLELEGYDVLAAPDGATALELVRSAGPSLLVLDLMMPHVDGLSVLRAVRESDTTRAIPVVITTAKTDDETTWAGWSGGCDYYMTKPFEPDDLLAAIERLLPPVKAHA